MTDDNSTTASSEEIAEGLLAVLSKTYPHLEGIDSITISGLSGDRIKVVTQVPGKDPFTQELTEDDLLAALEEASE